MSTEIWHLEVPVGQDEQGRTVWGFRAEGSVKDMDLLSDQLIAEVTGGLARDVLSDGKAEVYFAEQFWTAPIVKVVSFPRHGCC